MTPASRWIYAVSFVLASAGFLLPYGWPLSVIGVLLSALSGRWLFAILIGLLLDVAWGAPTGTARVLFFPFAAAALAGVAARELAARYFFNRGAQDRL